MEPSREGSQIDFDSPQKQLKVNLLEALERSFPPDQLFQIESEDHHSDE